MIHVGREYPGRRMQVERLWFQILVPAKSFSQKIYVNVSLYDHLVTKFMDKTSVSALMIVCEVVADVLGQKDWGLR